MKEGIVPEFSGGMVSGFGDGLRQASANCVTDGLLVGIAAGFVHLGEVCLPSSIRLGLEHIPLSLSNHLP